MRRLLALAAVTTAAGVLAGTVVGASTGRAEIAFTRAQAVWVIGADGSGSRKVAEPLLGRRHRVVARQQAARVHALLQAHGLR